MSTCGNVLLLEQKDETVIKGGRRESGYKNDVRTRKSDRYLYTSTKYNITVKYDKDVTFYNDTMVRPNEIFDEFDTVILNYSIGVLNLHNSDF